MATYWRPVDADTQQVPDGHHLQSLQELKVISVQIVVVPFKGKFFGTTKDLTGRDRHQPLVGLIS